MYEVAKRQARCVSVFIQLFLLSLPPPKWEKQQLIIQCRGVARMWWLGKGQIVNLAEKYVDETLCMTSYAPCSRYRHKV